MPFAYIGEFFPCGEDARGTLFQFRFVDLKVGCHFVVPGHTLTEATAKACRMVQ